MNEFLYFNSKPLSGDSIYMTYDAQVEIEGLRSLHFPVYSYVELGGAITPTVYKDRAKTIAEAKTVRASITIEANSDYDIYDHTGFLREAGGTTYDNIGKLYFYQDTGDYRNPTDDGARQMSTKALYAEFTSPKIGATNLNVRGYELRVSDYTNGPIVPLQYHRALCDYAIAIASAKQNPELYGRHWEMWQGNIEDIKERSFNREIVHSIRQEI